MDQLFSLPGLMPKFLHFGEIEGGKITKMPEFTLVWTHSCNEKAPTESTDAKSRTQEDLQEATRYLSSLDYISWNYKSEGCFIRAHIITEHLLSLSFKVEDLFLAFFPIRGHQFHLQFHEAAGVRLADGSKWIIDKRDKDEPIPYPTWIESQQKAYQTKDTPIEHEPFTTHSEFVQGQIPSFGALSEEERREFFRLNAILRLTPNGML